MQYYRSFHPPGDEQNFDAEEEFQKQLAECRDERAFWEAEPSEHFSLDDGRAEKWYEFLPAFFFMPGLGLVFILWLITKNGPLCILVGLVLIGLIFLSAPVSIIATVILEHRHRHRYYYGVKRVLRERERLRAQIKDETTEALSDEDPGDSQ